MKDFNYTVQRGQERKGEMKHINGIQDLSKHIQTKIHVIKGLNGLWKDWVFQMTLKKIQHYNTYKRHFKYK